MLSSDLIHESYLYEIDPFVLRLLKMSPLCEGVSVAAEHWLFCSRYLIAKLSELVSVQMCETSCDSRS